jgi:hypothetical protein
MCKAPDGASMDDCILVKPWREVLAKGDLEPAAERALYTALADIARIHRANTAFIEADYRLIDLDHRVVVAANRFALEAWDNVTTVPIDQIAAYHAGGVKTSEIADLIIKALGFTAVTTAIVSK